MGAPMRFKKTIIIKLVIYFIAMSIIPLIVLGVFAYYTQTDTVLNKIFYETYSSIEQINKNIESRFDTISYYLDSLLTSTEIERYIKNRELNINAKNFEIGRIFYRENYLQTAVIYDKTGEYKGVYKNTLKDLDVSWFNETLKLEGRINWIGAFAAITYLEKQINIFSCARALKNLSQTKPSQVIGAVYLCFSTDIFNDVIDTKTGDVYIFDASNKLIYTNIHDIGVGTKYNDLFNDIQISPSEMFDGQLGGTRYLMFSNDKNKYGITVIKTIPYSDVTSQAFKVTAMTILLIIICAVLIFLLILVISKTILYPLITVNNVMQELENGNLDVSVKITSNDEIGQVQYRLNKMSRNLKVLFAERIELEKERQREEIKALQYQINPHFLYNTLNAIGLMANIIHADNISNAIKSLIKLLKNAIGKVGEMVTLEEEIENINHFVQLLAFRYNKDINTITEIDERLKGSLVLNFILQPIIENSVFHGIIPTNENGVIKITASSTDNVMSITIKDNGKGMTKENLDMILNQEISEKGFAKIGVYNVNRRIKLNYGDEFGISIESRLNEGTSVNVRLPIINT